MISNLLAPKLLIICTVSVLAPIISDHVKRLLFIPSIVVEILLGIIIGPQVVDILQPTEQIDVLANVGLAFLMFLAGYEIDLKRIHGKLIGHACMSWLASFFMAIALMIILRLLLNISGGAPMEPLVTGLALTFCWVLSRLALSCAY